MADEFIVKNGLILKSGVITVGDTTTTGYALPATDGTNGQVLTTDGSGAITFQTPSGGGGTFALERLRVVYNVASQITSVDNTTSGINSTAVSGGTNLDITFTGYSYPPHAIMTYGYNNSSDVYLINHVTSAFGTRQFAANGGAIFGGLTTSETMRLALTTTNTGATSSQHAWVVFTFAG